MMFQEAMIIGLDEKEPPQYGFLFCEKLLSPTLTESTY